LARFDAYDLGDLEPDALASVVPPRGVAKRLFVAAVAMALASTVALAATSPTAAAPGTRVDVEPETLEIAVGQPATLTAVVRDAAGNPAVGPGSDTHVRWYFAAGSPNDPDPDNSSHSFECWTGEAGQCSMTYTPQTLGSDTICALVGGSPSACGEVLGAPDWADSADVILRIVVTSPTPTPTPMPSPTPTPTPDPTPTPTPDPTPDPTPTPSPDPTPSPTPDPTPDPTPSPTPTPSPDPTPSPTPDPTPSPTPTPSPSPTLTPDPTPTPSPSPTLTPDPTTAPTQAPTPTPGLTPDPAPDPTPTPTTPAVIPGPTSGADPAPTPNADGGDPSHGSPDSAPGAAAPPPVGPSLPETDGGYSEPAAAPMPQPAHVGPAPDRPAPNPSALSPFDILGSVVTGAVGNVGLVIQPAAALAVLLFLVIQDQVDRRDPKLRAAPRNSAEVLIRFETEEGT
jgi:hypothetical protein